MSKISVVYWSQTGNTEKMAEEIAKGIKEAGKEAALVEVSKASLQDLKEAATFALGCPAMGDEVLEESEMEPFVAQVETFVAGKRIGLFGSYDWGDGQWMRDWADRMTKAGAILVGGEGVIANNEPDSAALASCRELGMALAAE